MKIRAKHLRLLKQKMASFLTGRTGTKAFQGSKSWNIYRSCKELPLSIYIAISETGFYSLLDKNYNKETDKSSDPVPYENLIKQWNDIELEYTSLMAGNALNERMILAAQVSILSIKYQLVMSSIAVLRTNETDTLVDTLKDCGYPIKSKYSDKEKFFKELDIIEKKAKSIHLEIERRSIELDKMTKQNKSQDKEKSESEDIWADTLILLSDHAGFNLRAEDLTVYQYAKRVKNYINYVSSLNRQNSKK